MKSSMHRVALVMVTASMLILMFSVGSCRHSTPKYFNGLLKSPDQSLPVFIDEPVSFCWQRPLPPKSGKVQILVDASGSMVGFQRAIPPLVEWLQHSVSQIQSSLVIESSRLCQFSQSYGISKAAPINKPIAFSVGGNTNIHEAIRAAQSYDLTFILTDGVAATGRGRAGDCANGVDASCVARAMSEVVHTGETRGSGVEWGLWVIPLLANYDGLFYTEEPIVPKDFDTEKTIQKIRFDVGDQAQVAVTAPKVGSDGQLNFDYRGPRSMLLIVIARSADIGRDAIEALWDRTEYRGLQRLDQMKSFSAGLASFKPIEVYPGFLNGVQWKSLDPPDDPAMMLGTMDAFFRKESNKAVISLGCLKETAGEGVYKLTGSSLTAGQVSGCVPIRLLPAVSFRIRPLREEDEQDLNLVLKGFERINESYADLRLDLACGSDRPRTCGSNPISLQWLAYMNYGEAANALASVSQGPVVQQQIKELSTAHPSLEPHRIFGFASTLEAFYKEVAQDKRSIVLANIELCHKQ